MILEPVNKLLVVEEVELQHRTSQVDGFNFIVPDTTRVSRYSAVKLARAEVDSRFAAHEGKFLLVQSGMLDKITFGDLNFTVISETGVVAVMLENEL